MVTNIDFSSQQQEEKKSISGKPALIFSVALLVVVFASLFGIDYLKARYTNQAKTLDMQISQEQSKLNGPEFADAADFQQRLNAIDGMIDDHAYWDSMLKRISVYVIPEVKFNSFSAQKDASGASAIKIEALTTNLDTMSRELLLLKTFPDLDSLEFESAEASQGAEGNPGGIQFSINLKLNKSAFQK